MPDNQEMMSVDSTLAADTVFQRRYDVDWLRTFAMALLITYHVVLSFQPWAGYIGFPQNDPTLDGIWFLMAMINIWRIPVLFLISGMGVRFAMEHRNLKQLLTDRTIRILIPYIFGIFVLENIVSLTLPYLGWQAGYTITFGHLWFLLNIYLYFLWLIGFTIYFKDHPDNALLRFMSKLIRLRYGLFLLALPLVIEAWLTNPDYFSSYVDSVHGWIMGLICFFTGFILISVPGDFWPAVKKIRWAALITAFMLYLLRFFILGENNTPHALTAFESLCWILSVLGFGSLYLNKPSRSLSYFSKAVYPVYIIHLPLQFIIACLLLPLALPAFMKLILLLVATFGISLLLYEYVLRRMRWIRPLFGIKLNQD